MAEPADTTAIWSHEDVALVHAASAADDDLVKELLAIPGADVNVVIGSLDNETLQSPLTAAVQSGSLATVQTLLECGANPAPEREPCPITAALLAGRIDMADLLYRYGGRALLTIGFCFTNNYAAIGEILHHEPGRWPGYALDAIRSGNVEMLEHNLRLNPAIEPEQHGFVFLRSCIFQWRLVHRIQTEGFDRNRFQEMARMLLDWGADASARKDGAALLHVVSFYGRAWSPTEDERVEHAKLLLKYGADINARHFVDGKTPLDYALGRNLGALAGLLRGYGGISSTQMTASALQAIPSTDAAALDDPIENT